MKVFLIFAVTNVDLQPMSKKNIKNNNKY